MSKDSVSSARGEILDIIEKYDVHIEMVVGASGRLLMCVCDDEDNYRGLVQPGKPIIDIAAFKTIRENNESTFDFDEKGKLRG